MVAERLDRDAWIATGLLALEEGGVDAVAVVPLARALGVTRGSFYWHFASREELLGAVVERWEHDHSDVLLDALASVQDPRERLAVLLDRSTTKAPSIFVRLLEGADREPLVAAALERSAARRIDVLTKALRDAGLTPAEAGRRALLMYSAYVGLARLLRDDQTLLGSPRERAAYARHLAGTLIP